MSYQRSAVSGHGCCGTGLPNARIGGDGGARPLDPGLVDEVGLVLLPFGVGDRLKLIPGDCRDTGVERADAAFAKFAACDMRAGFGGPLADVDFAHGVDGGCGPVGEVQLVLEPERGGAGNEAGTMAGVGGPEI